MNVANTTGSPGTSSNKQPKAFWLIFSIELWERFGFYALNNTLAVFLVRSMHMSESQSFILFSSFTALIFGLNAFGGYIGDNIIGTKRAILLGAFTLLLGYLCIVLSGTNETMIYISLAVIAVGTGTFKANPSSLLSKCYAKDDPKLDGAFTLYYMSVNIGSFISTIITPVVASHYGWNIAFSLCVLGMAITFLNFLFCLKIVKNVGSEPDFSPLNKFGFIKVIACMLVLVVISTFLLRSVVITRYLLAVVAIVLFYIYFKEAFVQQGLARRKMFVGFILMVEAMIFFILYQQMPMSLNFFAIHNVIPSIAGISVDPIQFQALNPFWIVVASPPLAWIYNKMGANLLLPHKFMIGMFLCAFAFLCFPVAQMFATEQGMVSGNWMILSYFFQSVGELMISGLGLSMVAQYVPAKIMGFVMGIWYLASAGGSLIAGVVSDLTAVPSDIVDPLQTLPVYCHVFMEIGVATLVVAVILLVITPKLVKWTQEN